MTPSLLKKEKKRKKIIYILNKGHRKCHPYTQKNFQNLYQSTEIQIRSSIVCPIKYVPCSLNHIFEHACTSHSLEKLIKNLKQKT